MWIETPIHPILSSDYINDFSSKSRVRQTRKQTETVQDRLIMLSMECAELTPNTMTLIQMHWLLWLLVY